MNILKQILCHAPVSPARGFFADINIVYDCLLELKFDKLNDKVLMKKKDLRGTPYVIFRFLSGTPPPPFAAHWRDGYGHFKGQNKR